MSSLPDDQLSNEESDEENAYSQPDLVIYLSREMVLNPLIGALVVLPLGGIFSTLCQTKMFYFFIFGVLILPLTLISIKSFCLYAKQFLDCRNDRIVFGVIFILYNAFLYALWAFSHLFIPSWSHFSSLRKMT
jgi:hypothetical protein